MTQKDKLLQARMMAFKIRSIANSLQFDARDYDVQFPLAYARDLKQMADDFLKL